MEELDVLYLAEIDYTAKAGEKEEAGRFIALAEAGDVDSAMQKIENTILQARKREGMYPGDAEFSTGSIIQIEKLPEPGLLCFHEYSPRALGPEMGMICTTLPACDDSDQLESFFMPDEDNPEHPMEKPFFILDPDD